MTQDTVGWRGQGVAIFHKVGEAALAAKLPVPQGVQRRVLELTGYPFFLFRWELLFP